MQVSVGGLLTLAGLVLTVRAKGGETPAHGRFRLGLAAALVAALAWAVSVIILKPALEEVDAVRSQAIRLPLAAAMLWVTPWAWSARRTLRDQGRAGLWRLGALGALSAASSILFVAGVRHAGVAVATVLSSTAPIFALPLGFFFLGERVAPIARRRHRPDDHRDRRPAALTRGRLPKASPPPAPLLEWRVLSRRQCDDAVLASCWSWRSWAGSRSRRRRRARRRSSSGAARARWAGCPAWSSTTAARTSRRTS